MKKFMWGCVCVALFGALAFGAVTAYVVDSKTVATADEILELYYQSRNSLPPLPAPMSYEEVATQLSEGRVDFIADPFWAFSHDAGTYYLSDDSKLAKKLSLPMTVLAYEDLASGKVVLAGIPEATGKLQSLTIVDAPKFAPFVSVSAENYLMQELWPRRIIWTAMLKPEADAWSDLVRAEETMSMSVAPMMMTMSAPEEITVFEVVQDGTNISVNLPAEFAGADIMLDRRTNLLNGAWASVSTNQAASSGTMFLGYAELPEMTCEMTISTNAESISIDPLTGATNVIPAGVYTNCDYSTASAFYRVSASSTVDTDGDGLDNVSEYGVGTDYLWTDTSGDGLWDGWLVQYGFDPLGQYTLGDADNDGFSNLEEQAKGTDPGSENSGGDTGTVATIRYYYDEDDRLTDFYVGSEVAQKTVLTDAHNISEEVSAK